MVDTQCKDASSIDVLHVVPGQLPLHTAYLELILVVNVRVS